MSKTSPSTEIHAALIEATKALVDKLPEADGGHAYQAYFAKDELDRVRAELAKVMA
jgi:hypothetical protein